MKEVRSFFADVYKNTGIEVFLSSESIAEPCTEFEIEIAKTTFKVKIKGNTIVEKNYASLIKALSQNYKGDKELSKDVFFKSVLIGDLDKENIIRHTKKYQVKNSAVCTMIICAEESKVSEVKEVVANYGFGESDWTIDLDNSSFVYVKFASSGSAENFSMTEYAEFIYQSILEETGYSPSIFIGGTVNSIVELNKSYSQAQTSMRIGKTMGITQGVHSFKQFLIAKILEDLPKEKLNEYVGLLSDEGTKDLMSDTEITTTAHEFLENNLNASQTARKMFLHRNTLSYRLDKIQRETGLNIRNFSDAVTFRLINLLMNVEK